MDTSSPGTIEPGWLLAALTTAPTAGAPGGVTVRVTFNTWFPFGTLVELMVTVPMYVPAANVETTAGLSAIVSADGVVPLAGVTVTKLPPEVGVNVAVNGTLPPVLVT